MNLLIRFKDSSIQILQHEFHLELIDIGKTNPKKLRGSKILIHTQENKFPTSLEDIKNALICQLLILC